MRISYIKLSCLNCKCEYTISADDIEFFTCEICNENKLDLERMRKVLEQFNTKNTTDIKKSSNWSSELYYEDSYQNIDELMFELDETVFKNRNNSSFLEPSDFTHSFVDTKIKKVTTNFEQIANLNLNPSGPMIFIFYMDKDMPIFDISKYIDEVKINLPDKGIYFDLIEIEDSETQRVDIFYS